MNKLKIKTVYFPPHHTPSPPPSPPLLKNNPNDTLKEVHMF
jgi:hypothetical protein